jgi:archaellum component FlaG (FlaF/FlaG flagellin family)
MGLITWVAIIAIVLVAIGLGVGVFFSGLFRGAEIVGEKIQDNQAVQDAREEVEDFVGDRLDTGTSSEVLVITTKEATYDVGVPVTFTVKNIGDQTLTFQDSSLGLEIENVESGQKYSVISAQVITELPPDHSKEITWDDDAPAGDYTATVHTTPEDNVSAQVSFKITG